MARCWYERSTTNEGLRVFGVRIEVAVQRKRVVGVLAGSLLIQRGIRILPINPPSTVGDTRMGRCAMCGCMQNENCTCGTTTDGRNDGRGTFLGRKNEPLEAPLPDDVGAALGRLFETGSVPTLGAWVREVRRRTGEGAIAVEDLCHSEDETPHWGEIDGTRHHFVCFYDAVVLAALRDQSVDIRTESPEGETIKLRAVGKNELNVSPEQAVFSLGVEEDAAPPADRELRSEDLYAAICPYVKAFPDVESYERWAETVPAETVAMPLAGATEFASGLVE